MKRTAIKRRKGLKPHRYSVPREVWDECVAKLKANGVKGPYKLCRKAYPYNAAIVRLMRKLRPAKAKSRAKFRRLVMKKNLGRCVRCDYTGVRYWLAGPMVQAFVPATDPHHWLPVGRGGKDDPSNGIPLCRCCHDYITKHPAQAEKEGWLLNRGPMNESAKKIKAWMESRNK